ncbi:M36 family metallopeptidase [Permianibacter aggregans]|uniref:PA domain-containing protein n=1 Tax=Permianibacter aggregans TaxID=1510150 RepID=A0A4R6UYD0_9GAMM|nr:M36 family metallopeptidase [Permianibacter aggregans]QGX41286.1 hypothetical protein E2H98_17090 [Permianibacter aggregans]TDQ51069.1 PA domain-containing protein [Permianibacter aggregans]
MQLKQNNKTLIATLFTSSLLSLNAIAASVAGIDAERVEWHSNGEIPTFVTAPNLQLPGLYVSKSGQQWQQAADNLLPMIAPIYKLGVQAQQAAILEKADVSKTLSILTWRQHYDGVPIDNVALKVIADRNGKVTALSGYLSQQTPASTHSKSRSLAKTSISLAEQHLDLNVVDWQFSEQDEAGAYLFKSVNTKQLPTRAFPVYQLHHDQLLPAWKLEYWQPGRRNQLWAIIVSEQGEVLSKHSLTKDVAFNYRVYADSNGEFRPFDSPFGTAHSPHPTGTPDNTLPSSVPANLVQIEHAGIFTGDPWLPDTATTLTGNNADVYLDLVEPNGFNGGSDRRVSSSATRTFDYSLNSSQAPTATNNQNAAMVNAFFVVNWLHDMFYNAGFRENDENAQQDNYGRGGVGGDPILIEVQDYDGRNNANMSAGFEGTSPRMQIFLWDGPSTHSVQVGNTSYVTGRADFGPVNFNTTGQLVLMRDNAGTSLTDGCEDLTNAAELTGKIALVDRGNCNFIDKVARAESAGAIAVLVANHSPGVLTMGRPDGVTINPTIGSLIVSKADGDAIKTAMTSATVNATLSRITGGDVDGSFDLALVAHEWGHYLNNRLISIGNAQQSNGMDEGWSDFIALLMTVRPEDALSNYNGVYGFSSYSGSNTYYGIRRLPYSTDFNKNALTFRHISNGQLLPLENNPRFGAGGTDNAQVHATGEVWCSMLWEGYADLLRTRGFAEGHTRMKTYLVAGMKAIGVNSPTFTQARDALLAAIPDTDDRTLFRNAFARRGLGINAISPDIASDQNPNAQESYTWTPTNKPNVTVSGNQSVTEGATVSVSSTAADSDGTIASTEWKQVGGQPVTLTSTSGLTSGFTAPAVTTTDTIVLRFTATDNVGEKSDADVSITINGNNQLPTANAGTDQVVNEGATVQLRGTGTDADGTIVSYTWANNFSGTITLSPSAGPNVSFTAPTVNSSGTVITFTLTVVDNDGLSATDTVNVTVNKASVSPPPSSGGGGGGGSWSAVASMLLLLTLMTRRKKRS